MTEPDEEPRPETGPPPPGPGPQPLPTAPPVSRTEAPPPESRFLGRFAVLYGMGVGTLVYAIGFVVSLIDRSTRDPLAWLAVWAGIAVVVTIGVLFSGIVCVTLVRTRAFGAGLLISVAIGIIVGNGACIALLSNS
jgi:hypothetical protein